VQVVRHDIETPLCGLDSNTVDIATMQIIDLINKPNADVAIFSDYNKGFFSSKHQIIDLYKDVITIVDPKTGPLSKWKGCTVFKPNSNEAKTLTGLTQWKEQAKYLQNELECEAVVITFGGDQVSGIWNGEFFNFIPHRSVAVESVVGAGDCYAAFFAMAMGHGFSVPESAEIAWSAGAIYVQNIRNRPITPAELSIDGIVDPLDLTNRDFKLVMTNGCFDVGLTQGHVKCLEYAKQQGDKLVVAINSDSSIKRLKGGNRPIMDLAERAFILSSLKCVDFVVSFEEDTPLEVIQQIHPDIIIKGGDYTIEQVVGNGLAKIIIAPFYESSSTTEKLMKIYENTRL
jgi:D-beta-D-heptose 7-phosphate kinase/D-beta-D-heptose 1-phosphate adenosyltransferase